MPVNGLGESAAVTATLPPSAAKCRHLAAMLAAISVTLPPCHTGFETDCRQRMAALSQSYCNIATYSIHMYLLQCILSKTISK
jgi:hypothetical protein